MPCFIPPRQLESEVSDCRILPVASDAPVRGTGFTPGRSSPGARAVLPLAPDAPIRGAMFLCLLADFGVCMRGALVFCLFLFFFARPSSLLLPRSPRSALLSPPFPLPLRPRSSLPVLPFSPFVLAFLGHALKLLVSTRACCYVLGRAHTFILLPPFLPAFCSRALFLFRSRPLSYALCVAFAYLLSSPLLFVWGTHTSSYSYACSLPPFSSSIQSFVLDSCRTPFMCVTMCRHRGERRGELATCIPAYGVRFPIVSFFFFPSWPLCFLASS